MATIEGQVLALPRSDERPPAIAVNLRYLLTTATPFKRTYLDYWRDQFDWVDYGTMLCQQLRRCEGVGPVRINHYGCRVEVGELYTTREMLPVIRSRVESTLRSRIPWTIHRPDNKNWCYQFAVPSYALEPSAPLGRQLHDQLTGSLGGPRKLYNSRLFMQNPGDRDWRTVDGEYDPVVTRIVGTRDLAINWE